ncbi:MAG: aminoacyl-tRNA hydrolase [Oscillospiraceae bacterium]|jgi:PTH1 family peptidyl-tRNA hydrolase|nr:aminoacyl-tRNA hydrolase [Oscillospiraceae bacterium]
MLDDLFAKLFPRPAANPPGPVEYIVAGLGNPGREYEDTRHNAGYLAVEALADMLGVKITRLRFKSLCAECLVAGKKALLLKPATFMNLSGQAVTEALAFYKLPPERLIVICDDIALSQGTVRVRKGGSDGGQKGLKNIIYLLGSDNFPRIRVGIGPKAHPDMDLVDWVIGRFSQEESERLKPALNAAARAAELIAAGNINEAMNRFNRKSIEQKNEDGV